MNHKSGLLTSNGTRNRIESQVNESLLQDVSDDDDYLDDFRVVWETEVQPLTDVQRHIFLCLTIFILTVAVVGNMLVLYVNFSRNMRFFLRICLISLAISDLIYVIVTSWIYISKLRSSTSALWKLGPITCILTRYLQTMFVIVSSLFLVVIALDRYFSVVSINRTRWQPSKLFCVISCAFIWTFSAFISSPVIQIYYHFKIYIRKNQKPEGINENLKYYAGYICGRKTGGGLYFAIVFTVIFTPFLITFCWCNTVLAKEIWQRRVDVEACNDQNNIKKTVAEGNIMAKITARRVERKQRQIRMFKVILILMSVFLICRLPTWIYVLYLLKNPSHNSVHNVLYFVYGLIVMANCMMNPFLYSFLRDTIRLTTFLSGIVRGIFSPCLRLCKLPAKDCKKQSCDN